MMSKQTILVLFVGCISLQYVNSAATTCAAMDTCVTTLKGVLGNTGTFEYTNANCKAVTDALTCFKAADITTCPGYSKPDTSAYTYDNLVTEFATYCTTTAVRATCVPLKSCIDTIKLPTVDTYYTLPNYWCGVLTAAITCDAKQEAADTVPNCLAAPADTKVKTWCDGIADLTTTDYTPPVDGGWGAWSTPECSVTCGGGTQRRTRVCNDPIPSGTGADCVGVDTESQVCNTETCPVTGCGTVDSCIKSLKSALAGADGATAVFEYTDTKCKAVKDALTCFQAADKSACSDYTDPIPNGVKYDYTKLMEEFAYYCTDTAVLKTCQALSTCVNKIKLPAKDIFYPLPEYWCGVITAAIDCDTKDDTTVTAACKAAPAVTNINNWCPGVQNVVDNAYDPANDVKSTTTSAPTCAAMDTCVTGLKDVLGNAGTFEYTDAKCKAVTDALTCFKAADITTCTGYTKPDTSAYTYDNLVTEFATYCTTTGTTARATCVPLKTCIDTIKLPTDDMFYTLPNYWCGVLTAAINCDKADGAGTTVANCLAAPADTKVKTWCDGVADLTTTDYTPPVNGGWGAYSAYSDCSVTCGGGVKTRTRVCNDPIPSGTGADCVGDDTESQDCNTEPCPVTGCATIDTCINNLSPILGHGTATTFEYTKAKCMAVIAALNCFQVANVDGCVGYKNPLTGADYTYTNLATELGKYCTAGGDGTVFKTCTTLTTCVNKIKLPANAKSYALPDYWCGVLTAALTCDSTDDPPSDQATDCKMAPAKQTWCPNVQNVADKAYVPEKAEKPTPPPAPKCATMDACVTNLKTALGAGTFEYIDAKCKAVTDALACFKAADITTCTGYTKPDTSAYTYDNLVSEFGTYCTAAGKAVRATCVPLKTCIDTIKLPTVDMFYTLPNYWCGVLTAAITCDAKLEAAASVANCLAAPEDTNVKKWCDGVADLTTTDYTPPKVTSTAAPVELTTSDASPRVKYSIGVMLFLSLVSQL